MEIISEPRGILNGYLGWNKARATCLTQLLLGVMTASHGKFEKSFLQFYRKSQILVALPKNSAFFCRGELVFGPLVATYFWVVFL